MSAAADRLFDDYWFVLARTGRARGPGGDRDRPAPSAMRETLLNAVTRKPQVMVKITSFARSKEGLAAHLDYISRNGQNEVFDPTRERFSTIGAQMGLAARDALQHYGRELGTGPILEGPAGKKKGRPRSRVSMNLMLSMPAGTDTGPSSWRCATSWASSSGPMTTCSPSMTTATTTTPMSWSACKAMTAVG